jgi:peroxiredoxin
MALTPSNPFEIGKKAADFSLRNTVDNSIQTLDNLKGKKGTVLVFICNHCPFVVHINEGLVQLATDYLSKGIGFVAISSNDVINYPQDGPNHMREIAKKLKYPFPYLYDESQQVAKAYDAACTPDFYVFDEHLKSVYHGQLDHSRPGNGIPVTGEDVRHALDNLLQNKQPIDNQKPSIGCSIKWK